MPTEPTFFASVIAFQVRDSKSFRLLSFYNPLSGWRWFLILTSAPAAWSNLRRGGKGGKEGRKTEENTDFYCRKLLY